MLLLKVHADFLRRDCFFLSCVIDSFCLVSPLLFTVEHRIFVASAEMRPTLPLLPSRRVDEVISLGFGKELLHHLELSYCLLEGVRVVQLEVKSDIRTQPCRKSLENSFLLAGLVLTCGGGTARFKSRLAKNAGDSPVCPWQADRDYPVI